LSFNANATFVKNNVSGLPAPLIIQTGTLSGQRLSGVLIETIQNGQPLNGYYLPTYNGITPAPVSTTNLAQPSMQATPRRWRASALLFASKSFR